MLTVFCIAYNEEIMLPHMIKWYRDRFTDCNIIVYDNYSTDKTRQIAFENNCGVISFGKQGELSNSAFLEVKNNCWKSAETEWVLVCDVDEMLNIYEEELKQEHDNGVSIIKSKGWDVVNLKEDFDIESMDCGCNSPGYSKNYLFNKEFIEEMNYEPGCHTANPAGYIHYSEKEYNLYHKRYVNTKFLVDRYKDYSKRRCQEDKNNNWATHYDMKEKDIQFEFEDKRKHCVKI